MCIRCECVCSYVYNTCICVWYVFVFIHVDANSLYKQFSSSFPTYFFKSEPLNWTQKSLKCHFSISNCWAYCNLSSTGGIDGNIIDTWYLCGFWELKLYSSYKKRQHLPTEPFSTLIVIFKHTVMIKKFKFKFSIKWVLLFLAALVPKAQFEHFLYTMKDSYALLEILKHCMFLTVVFLMYIQSLLLLQEHKLYLC